MKKQILLALMALISLESLQAAEPSEPTPKQPATIRLLNTKGLGQEISTAFNQRFVLDLMTNSPFKEAVDSNNITEIAKCMLKQLRTVPAIAATTTYNHVKTNCTNLLLQRLEEQYNLGERYLSNKLNLFHTFQRITYFALPLYIEHVTNSATQGLEDEGVYFNLHGGLPVSQHMQSLSGETPYEPFRRLDKETPEQRKIRFDTLRAEVTRERNLLETDTNEDKKYALIQRISKTQSKYDDFITKALFFYRMHATEVEKAQLKLHFEKATSNSQKLEALMASVKQNLHPDNIDFEQDIESFVAQVTVFQRIHTELKNSLQTLKKDLPEVL